MLTLEDHQELAAHTADQLRELIRKGGWSPPFKIEWAGADDRAIFWFVTDGKQMLQSDPNDPVEDSEFPVTISITDINDRHLWMKIERVAPH